MGVTEVIVVLTGILLVSCAAEAPRTAGTPSPEARASAPSPSATATATPRPVPAIDRIFASQDCSASQASEFDFWVGVWDVDVQSANGVEVTGTQRITKEGCLVFEHFDAPLGGRKGYIGESVSQWVPSLGKWQQRYADNHGFVATYTGEFTDGAMILYESDETGKILNRSRLVWKEIEPDQMLWHNEVTSDVGKTYTATITIRYERSR